MGPYPLSLLFTRVRGKAIFRGMYLGYRRSSSRTALERRSYVSAAKGSKNVNPKIVSQMLGHASIAITLDTYSHVLPNMQDSAVTVMEEAFA
jgi:integrase